MKTPEIIQNECEKEINADYAAYLKTQSLLQELIKRFDSLETNISN